MWYRFKEMIRRWRNRLAYCLMTEDHAPQAMIAGCQESVFCSEDACQSLHDPRCGGRLCTYHCKGSARCSGICLKLWEDERNHEITRQAIERAQNGIKASDAEFLKRLNINPE